MLRQRPQLPASPRQQNPSGQPGLCSEGTEGALGAGHGQPVMNSCSAEPFSERFLAALMASFRFTQLYRLQSLAANSCDEMHSIGFISLAQKAGLCSALPFRCGSARCCPGAPTLPRSRDVAVGSPSLRCAAQGSAGPMLGCWGCRACMAQHGHEGGFWQRAVPSLGLGGCGGSSASPCSAARPQQTPGELLSGSPS